MYFTRYVGVTLVSELMELTLSYMIPTKPELDGMRTVTVLDVYDGSSRNFHPDGLFSVQTFGTVGMEMRNRLYGYIPLPVPVMNPHFFQTLCKLDSLVEDLFAGKRYGVWDPSTKQFTATSAVEGSTGYAFVMEHLDELVFKVSESVSVAERAGALDMYRSKRLISQLLVWPAGYRDYIINPDTGKPEEGEVNTFYRKVLQMCAMIPATVPVKEYASVDNTRHKLQLAIGEVYTYFFSLLNGKHKVPQGKFAHRNIMHGTANVITSLINDSTELHGPNVVKNYEMAIGIYQYMKSTTPKTIYDLRTGFLASVFSTAQSPANLVDKKTLRSVNVSIDIDTFERWYTVDGLEKLMTDYGIESLRHETIDIDGYYLGLLYNDGKAFMVLNGIDLLPDGFDKKYLSPITFTELMYISIYKSAMDSPGTSTRYPAANEGSIYLIMNALFSTSPSLRLKELLSNGEESGSEALRFPVRGADFVNSASPPNKHIQRAAADFDGDRKDNKTVMTEEAKVEIKKTLQSASYYVLPTGELIYQPGDDILDLVLSHMTGDPEPEAEI